MSETETESKDLYKFLNDELINECVVYYDTPFFAKRPELKHYVDFGMCPRMEDAEIFIDGNLCELFFSYVVRKK